MPIDRSDPDVVAALAEERRLVTTSLTTAHESVVSTLTAAKTAAEQALAAATTAATDARAAADAAAADANSTKTERDALKAKAERLELAETQRQTAADAASIAALPEGVRRLVPSGLSGEALAAWVTDAKAAVVAAPVGLNGGSGSPVVATDAQKVWAESMGFGPVTDSAKIIAAYNKVGPGRKLTDAAAKA